MHALDFSPEPLPKLARLRCPGEELLAGRAHVAEFFSKFNSYNSILSLLKTTEHMGNMLALPHLSSGLVTHKGLRYHRKVCHDPAVP